MALVLVPASSDETATAYCWSVGEYFEGQDECTVDNLKAMAVVSKEDPSKLDDMDPEDRYIFLVDTLGYYTFDQLVVIDEKHLPFLEQLSDAAINGNCDDSGWYSACEAYNNTLRYMGEKTINFYGNDIVPCDF